MEFFTRFNCPPSPVETRAVEAKSLTQQQFRDECDVNYIIAHFQDPARPSLVQPSVPRVPLFGDFSAVPDVRSAHDVFVRAGQEFMSLPAEIRQKFNNNPVEMLAFLETAQPDQVKSVFGVAPDKDAAEVVTPVAGVSDVNAETVKES